MSGRVITAATTANIMGRGERGRSWLLLCSFDWKLQSTAGIFPKNRSPGWLSQIINVMVLERSYRSSMKLSLAIHIPQERCKPVWECSWYGWMSGHLVLGFWGYFWVLWGWVLNLPHFNWFKCSQRENSSAEWKLDICKEDEMHWQSLFSLNKRKNSFE